MCGFWTRTLFLALIVVGCTPRLSLIPVTDFSDRRECLGFSVLPPKGDNWSIGSFPNVAQSAELGPRLCSLLFVKMVADNGTPKGSHTAFALGWISKPNHVIQTADELLSTVERQMKQDLLPRYRLLQHEAQVDNSLGSTCVRYERMVEDLRVPQFPGSVFIETDKGYECIHPTASTFVVFISYSERFLKGQKPLVLEEEIAPFFKSLLFAPIKTERG